MKRRTLLKASLAATTLASAGALFPRGVMAAYPQSAFDADTVDGALTQIVGSIESSESSDIKIKAPAIAENGAVVPIQVTSDIAGIESISIIASANPSPLAASFNLHGSEGFVSVRLKLGKTSDIIAVVKADGALYSARQEVKVTIGGCGG